MFSQMALERGLPAVLGYVGSLRLPYPSNVFDVVHCARCRIKWYGNGMFKVVNLGPVRFYYS